MAGDPVPGCDGDLDTEVDFCILDDTLNAQTIPPATMDPTDTAVTTEASKTMEPTMGETMADTDSATMGESEAVTGDASTERRELQEELPLDIVGNNGEPTEIFPLARCMGDCDNDGEVSANTMFLSPFCLS